MNQVKLLSASFAALVVTGALVVASQRGPTSAAGTIPPITVAALPVPTDIPGTAPSANIQQAAAFAWQEFIALNWPAVPQTAAAGTRDTPDTKCLFEDPKCAARPRVWHTFRAKLEIFPGNGSPPPGYTNDAASDYGYDAAPKYNYKVTVNPCTASPAQDVVQRPALINADESDQITLDSMFSGAGPTTFPGNSDPQMIRFLAKGNRTQYDYVASNKFWFFIPIGIRNDTQAYLATNHADPSPVPPGTKSTLISLPYGTIEAKAAFRVLTKTEMNSGRFQMATTRYYEFVDPNATPKSYCWREATFGLVALHIIQRTPSAPYFIYATFEQPDNIRTAQGKPLENDDGSITVQPGCPPGQSSPCPTTPLETLLDGPTPFPNSAIPPHIVLQPQPSIQQKYCTASLSTRPKNQLYFLNEGTAMQQPIGGFVCVNSRMNPIPPQIIAVNRAAQSAIRSYEQQHGFAKPSALAHYKLVNVQYFPFDNPRPAPFTGHDWSTGDNPANFYLANIVVETNRSLQRFNGGLLSVVQAQYAGRFAAPPTVIPGSPTHKNTVYGGISHDFNMGGCMGCHGSQGQSQGGNFSVILARGGLQNMNPEPPAPIGPSGTKALRRNRALVKY